MSHCYYKQNHIFLPKPAPVDPDHLRPATPINQSAQTNRPVGAFLIGASTKSHPFTEKNWQDILKLLSDRSQDRLFDWVVTTSPRTPNDIADMFKSASETSPAIKTFVDFRESGPGSILSLLNLADFTVCTEDSSSMITESICARRPTISLQPETFELTSNEEKMLDSMCQENYLKRLPIQAHLAEDLQMALQSINAMPENHLDKLAEAIAPLLTSTDP